jgi:hypothetical protein
MNFSDFFHEEEQIDLLSEALLDEGLWDIGAGLARSAAGALTVGDEALAKAVGQGTKGRMSRGASDFVGGLHRAVFGRPQQAAPDQTQRTSAAEIEAVAKEFERLKKAYKQAESLKDRNLMRRIRARMYSVDPAAYAELVARSQEKRRELERRRWSAAASAPKPERPESFLGRLSAEG